jgi:hypothetical protein
LNNISSPNGERLLRWWQQCLFPPEDDPYESIRIYAYERLNDIRATDGCLDLLAQQLHKCKAKTWAQFRQWCCRRIDEEADRLARKRNKRRGIKPFQPVERDGIYHIALLDLEGQEHIWKVPPDFIDEVETRLWPVHVRKHANGKPFLARKRPINGPGGRKQVILPAHHAYLWFKYPGISKGDITCARARNGDFLDWTNDNLYVPTLDGLAVSESTKEFRLKQAIAESSWKQIATGDGYDTVPVGIDPSLIEEWERKLMEGMPGDRDLMDCGAYADVDITNLRDSGYNGHKGWPDKPTRPPGNGPDMDDGDKWLASHLYAGMERDA